MRTAYRFSWLLTALVFLDSCNSDGPEVKKTKEAVEVEFQELVTQNETRNRPGLKLYNSDVAISLKMTNNLTHKIGMPINTHGELQLYELEYLIKDTIVALSTIFPGIYTFQELLSRETSNFYVAIDSSDFYRYDGIAGLFVYQKDSLSEEVVEKRFTVYWKQY